MIPFILEVTVAHSYAKPNGGVKNSPQKILFSEWSSSALLFVK